MRRVLETVATLVVLALLTASAPAHAAADRDPWEALNRKTFWVNDQLDTFILKPVAIAWDWILPDPVETAVSNVYQNAEYPFIVTNQFAQLKFGDARVSTERFLVNTVVGLVGVFDVADRVGIEDLREDFGQTLHHWGVGSGPYLVLPVYGPSTVRDATANLVDNVLRIWPLYADLEIQLAVRGVEAVNWRSLNRERIDNIQDASFDYYTAVRDGWLQRRQAQLEDRLGQVGAEPETPTYDEEDLYFFDDEDELEEEENHAE